MLFNIPLEKKKANPSETEYLSIGILIVSFSMQSILTINVSKTPEEYSALGDIISGCVVAHDGDFENFENYVRKSIDFY